MSEQFSRDLTEAAAQARDVDLSARVRAASRRLTIQRTIVGCVAAMALLLAGTVGVSLLQPDAEASPTDFERFGGALLYVADDSAAGTAAVLRRDAQATSAIADTAGPVEAGGVRVSPTGEWAAWEVGDADGRTTVMVAELPNGGGRELFSYHAPTANCPAPTWAPDGSPQLLTTDPDSTVSAARWINVDTGEPGHSVPTVKERSGLMCELYPAERPDGGYDLYYTRSDDAELRYLDPDGGFHSTGVVAALRESGDDTDGNRATGLSADGLLACLAVAPSPRHRCDTVVNLETKAVHKDFGDTPPHTVLFQPDGGLVTQDADGVIKRFDAAGDLVAELPADAEFVGYRLAGYLPTG